MSLFVTEGIVLRTRPLGEADLLVTVYTATDGKTTLAARGARRGKSRLLACTQPFSESRFQVWRGRTLDNLSQAEVIQSFRGIREDLLPMAYGSYVVELLDFAVPEREPNQELYGLLRDTLTRLARRTQREFWDLAVHVFEARLMCIIGYEPEVAVCASCGAALGETVRFSLELGGALCPHCFTRDRAAVSTDLAVLGCIERLKAGLVEGELPWQNEAQAEEVRRLMTAFAGSRIDRPLKSREFLELVRR